jgi:hypothetical protein
MAVLDAPGFDHFNAAIEGIPPAKATHRKP